MTEEEWLTSTDPEPLLQSQGTEASERKMRLFACACCRRAWHLLTDERNRKVIEVAEQMCDGDADADQLAIAVAAAAEAAEYQSPFIDAVEATCFEIAIEHLGIVAGALEAATAVARGVSSSGVQNPSGTYDRDPRIQAAERLAQCGLLRDIFGNPFRPVAFDPAWRTSTAVALARQMYDSRDFGFMPILGDALQDAGCESADILEHCRGDGPHVRGCWVVDLALGKQ